MPCRCHAAPSHIMPCHTMPTHNMLAKWALTDFIEPVDVTTLLVPRQNFFHEWRNRQFHVLFRNSLLAKCFVTSWHPDREPFQRRSRSGRFQSIFRSTPVSASASASASASTEKFFFLDYHPPILKRHTSSASLIFLELHLFFFMNEWMMNMYIGILSSGSNCLNVSLL